MVSGTWLNRKVLMLNETIQSASQHQGGESQTFADNKSDNDSIFNIELSNIMQTSTVINQTKDLMSETYQAKRTLSKRGNSSSKRGVQVTTKGLKGSSRQPSGKQKSVKCEWHSTKGSSSIRQTSKKSIVGMASGYQVDAKRSSMNQDISQRRFGDQDIHPKELETRVDSEGQKYLNYHSISGFDNVPRIRKPSPI